MTISSISSRYNANLFVTVRDSSPLFSKVSQLFKKYIEPIYEDQRTALQKIGEGKDQCCKVLLQNDEPVGLFVYKEPLQNISSSNLPESSLQIEHFLAVPLQEGADLTNQEKLLEKIVAIAQEKLARGIFLKISSKEERTIALFQRYNFHRIPSEKESIITLYKSLKNPGKILSRHKRSTSPQEEKISPEKKETPFSRKRVLSIEEGPKEKRIKQEKKPLFRKKGKPPPTDKWHLTLKKPYIYQIRSGKKTVEGRIYAGSILNYREGGMLRFFYTQNPRDDVTCKITKIEKFSSFRQMLESCGVQNCLPEVGGDLEKGVRVYENIPSYKERAKEQGVAAIHLQVISRQLW